MPLAIEDYALIGDCHTAALVHRTAHRLAVPAALRLPACFGALLGDEEHGAGDRAGRRDRCTWRAVHGRHVDPRDALGAPRGRGHGDRLDAAAATGGPTSCDGPRRQRHRADGAGARVRFDYGRTVPWIRRAEAARGAFAVAGPDAVRRVTAISQPATVDAHDPSSRSPAGEAVDSRCTWFPRTAPPPEPSTSDDALEAHPRVSGGAGRTRCRFAGRTATRACVRCSCCRRSPTRPPAASSRRRRPRCRSTSAAGETGTTATAGCATRR